MQNIDASHTKIAVIGAGIAGLRAASQLAALGYQVDVLEARQRPGGRISSYRAHRWQVPIELGAQYWEGFSHNPMYQRYFHPPSCHLFKMENCYFSTNKEAELRYYAFAQNALQNTSPPTTHSYLQWLNTIDLSAHTTHDQSKIRRWLYYEHKQHATPLEKIGWPQFHMNNSNHLLEAWNDKEANFCFVKGGYDSMVQRLVAECQQLGVSFHFNQTVRNIRQTSHAAVTIQCATKIFFADKVICTLPIGVLKSQHQQLFTPELPSLKKQALATIGVHFALRVVLIFDTLPFWDPIDAPYLFIETPDYITFREFRSGYPLHGVTVLQTDSYADVALSLQQKHSDDTKINALLLERILQDLKKHFSVPTLAQCFIKNWSADPFAQGAYVYRTAKMTECLQTALEQPFMNLYFAGGDFSRCGFSVHNAYANGQRAAQQCHHDRLKSL